MEPKPVWILNHYGGQPGQVRSDRTWRLAEALGRAGFQVTLFHASHHHILNAPVPEDQVDRILDSGRGYRVCAIATRPYRGNGLARLGNMLDFVRGVTRLWKKKRIEAPAVVIASSPHPFVLCLAAKLKRTAGSAFIFEERDIWPRSLVELTGVSWLHPSVLVFGALVKSAYRRCDALVSLLPKSEPYLRSWGLPPGRFHYIPNGVLLDEGLSEPAEAMPEKLRGVIDGARERGEFLVVYTGAMGPPNALQQWFAVAPLVAAERKGGAYPYRVLMLGEGWERRLLEEKSAQPGYDFVSVHGPVSKAVAQEVVRMADAGAISLRPEPLFQLGVSPNKLFDYFAASKPVLFLVDSVHNPVEEAQAGITVPPGDPAKLHHAVMALRMLSPDQRGEMGQRGRAYAEEYHNWSQLGRQYAALVTKVIQSNRPPPVLGKRLGRGIKRALDFALGLAALVVLAPVLAAVACLVAIFLGRPVLFRQPRIGLNGGQFELIKFRSMSDARDSNGQLLPDRERLTRFGRFLRASSLDELPELWNVVRGDLSLVGPRPLLVEYLPLYNARQARRHEVRPGITGWAQVNGRNATSWEERFDLDVWYVDHQSLALDFRILVQTVGVVFRGTGIHAEGNATMPKFTGSPGLQTDGDRASAGME